jgi:two-component system, NtrC family, sensor kinase
LTGATEEPQLSNTRSRKGTISTRRKPTKKRSSDRSLLAARQSELTGLTAELKEALQLQAATANILKMIASSSTAVGPVLEAIVRSASELCGDCDASVFLKVSDDLDFSAHHGPIPTSLGKRPINRSWVAGRSVVDNIPVQVSDFLAPAAAEFPDGRELGRRYGHRCALSVPLVREGEAVGAIALRRMEPGPFSEKQIALLQTFADQAVIAIENVRLFEQAQAKARDLEESLMQQTATADVLKVINRSTFDLQPVLSALVETVARFCHADFVLIHRRETERYRCVATFGLPSEYNDYIRTHTFPVDRGTVFGRAVLERKIVEVEDLAKDPEYLVRQTIALGKGRTVLGAPLLREGQPIGAIVVARHEPRRFTQRQIGLVATFADQAVIAIENSRLLMEQRNRHLALEQEVKRRIAEFERVQEALMAAQQELARANRIATAGALSTSIAHDLNQPLGAVIMDTQACLKWLQRDPPDMPAAIAAADRSVRNSIRASEIVKKTRERLIQGRRNVADIDVEQLVRGTIVLLEREIMTHRASVSSTFAKPGLFVSADRTELQQVLVNLIVNGLHAMAAGQGEKHLSIDVCTPIPGRIQVAVRDTGHGINSENMHRLFEPFFTTKAGGMGMGLSICQATVQAWGGCLRAENHPESGAVFTFDLPLSDKTLGA